MNVTFIAMPIKTSLTLESSPCYAFTYFSNNIAIILYCTRTNLSINLLITPSQSNVTNKSNFCTSLTTQFSQNWICCHICHTQSTSNLLIHSRFTWNVKCDSKMNLNFSYKIEYYFVMTLVDITIPLSW